MEQEKGETMKHKFTTERDGSLVCDGVVVVSPGPEFPKSAIAQLVKQANDSASLLDALQMLAREASRSADFHPSLKSAAALTYANEVIAAIP